MSSFPPVPKVNFHPLTPPRGESGVGTWTIVVKDTNVNEFSGKFVDWHLKLWGESRDASKATLLPMPTEEDDNDHALIATTTLPATFTTIPPATDPSSSTVPADATDVPNRPVNSKPTPSPADDDDEAGSNQTTPPTPESSSAAGNTTSTWLPSFLPTFGVSAATQAWIYGSLVLIVLFCSGLGVYFYLARRRRLRNNPRNDYEFELLDDEEAEGLASGEKNAAPVPGAGSGRRGGAGGGRTRGGELYDAFAGESSDGEDDDDDDSDDFGDVAAAGGYRDRRASEESSEGGSSGRGRISEKRRGLGREEEEEHHVVGDDDDDDDDDESEEEEARPLRTGR